VLRRAELIAALRLRYDHYSAESVFEAARSRCGYVDQETYSPNEVAQLRAALAKVGDRMGNVFAQLDALLDTPAAPAPPPAQVEPVVAAPTVVAGPVREEIETTVALTGLEAATDEQLLMCGGAPDLGDWDPEKACPMTRAQDAWTTTLRVPTDAAIEFKFIRRAADGTLTWEPGDNRTLVAKPRLEVTWR
jgi:hypothetical protein